MVHMPRVVIASFGAAALAGGVFTNAMASQPHPFYGLTKVTGKSYVVAGNLNVNGILHANQNESVYGHFYAHNGAQVWKSFIVRTGGMQILSGGLKTDALTVTGTSPVTFQNAAVTNALQAGSISAGSLAVTSGATVAGKLTVSGGIDAGGSAISTTGALSAGSVTTGTLNTSGNVNTGTGTITTGGIQDNGNLTANSIATSGAITANAGAVFKGTVDFSQATVTGLQTGGIGSNFTTLTVGTNGATNPPFTLTANNHSTTLGVTTSGQLALGPISETGDLAVSGNGAFTGNLAVSGSGGVTTSVVSAPAGTNNSLTALTLQGNGINLNGTTSLQSGSDLVLPGSPSASSPTASHFVAGSNRDVAGTVGVSLNGPLTNGANTASVTFIKPFASLPIVVLTPTQDPNAGSSNNARYWVVPIGSGPYTGFTVYYVAGSGADTTRTVPFNYHVIGS